MNNLIEIQKLYLKNLKSIHNDINSFDQTCTPKLSNIELVTINLTAEYMPINTELQLFRCLHGTYLEGLNNVMFITKDAKNHLLYRGNKKAY